MPDAPPDAPRLDVARDGTAVVARIHNPARANALDSGILDALARLAQAPPDDARLMVLTGAGDRHFSSGLDLGEDGGAVLEERLRAGESLLGRVAGALAECPIPVVAAVNGAAFGGALELAMACDWRIAAEDATLAMPAARLGVIYAPEGMRRFLQQLGPARTRQLFLTGRPVDARRALEIGLVDEVVPAGTLDDAVRRAAEDLGRSSPLAVAGTRAAIAALSESPGEDGAAVVEQWRVRAYASDQFREGIAAFHERRRPRW
ncbi:MAG TPA: enoyl-CoA hydratase/isomerase family protein [Miltoncostaeaceae bacterium]|nr:enoyl-CoA hydratase/isomerase family protein [Miltoncostaeaceae bacterium]